MPLVGSFAAHRGAQFKVLATTATVGSGAVGGVFTPALFSGAMEIHDEAAWAQNRLADVAYRN